MVKSGPRLRLDLNTPVQSIRKLEDLEKVMEEFLEEVGGPEKRASTSGVGERLE